MLRITLFFCPFAFKQIYKLLVGVLHALASMLQQENVNRNEMMRRGSSAVKRNMMKMQRSERQPQKHEEKTIVKGVKEK